MSGGGSSGSSGGQTTQQSNQYSNVSPWAQPYISNVLGAAQQQVFSTDSSGNVTGVNPYTAYGMNGAGLSDAAQQAAQASVAAPSALQQQSYQTASGLGTPGQFGMGTMAAGAGTMQALGAGQNLQNTLTNPGAMSQYMNPYLQNVLAPQQQLLNQQYGIAGQQAASGATSAGAFGGTRNALQQNLNAQNQMLAQNQLASNAYNTAYNNAQTQANNVANLGLQGAQAGIAGGTALGNLGTNQLAATTSALNTQNTLGTQQQQNQQNIINQAMQNYATAQQYPMTQLTNLKSLISGLPITDVTTTQETAAPSTTSALASLGTAGIGAAGLYNAANKKKGGIIKTKKMAPGGIATIGGAIGSVENSLDTMDDTQLQQVVKTTASPFIRKQAQELLAEHQADAMAANSRGAGITAAPTNNMFSQGGGIVSFSDGSTVPPAQATPQTPAQGSELNWLNLLKQQGFGQPSAQDLELQAQNKQAYADAQQSQNLAPWLGMIQGAGEGLQNTSPFASVGLGKLLTGVTKGVSENDKQAADQLAKIRAGELDLSKLNSTDRNNLLHYTLTAATSEEGNKLRVQELEEAAKLRAQTADIAAQNRLSERSNAIFTALYADNIKSARDSITGRPLTKAEKDAILDQTIEQVDRILQVQGKKGLNTTAGGNTGSTTPPPPEGYVVPKPS